MQRSARGLIVGFAALAVFQAVLAAGVPMGRAAWGGEHAHLTTGQRIGSAASVLVYLTAIVIVRRRSAGRPERLYRWGIWALAGLLAAAALANVASGSAWENFLLAPVAIVLAALCVVVARGRRRASGIAGLAR